MKYDKMRLDELIAELARRDPGFTFKGGASIKSRLEEAISRLEELDWAEAAKRARARQEEEEAAPWDPPKVLPGSLTEDRGTTANIGATAYKCGCIDYSNGSRFFCSDEHFLESLKRPDGRVLWRMEDPLSPDSQFAQSELLEEARRRWSKTLRIEPNDPFEGWAVYWCEDDKPEDCGGKPNSRGAKTLSQALRDSLRADDRRSPAPAESPAALPPSLASVVESLLSFSSKNAQSFDRLRSFYASVGRTEESFQHQDIAQSFLCLESALRSLLDHK